MRLRLITMVATMRRVVTVMVAVVLAAAACSNGDGEAGPAATTQPRRSGGDGEGEGRGRNAPGREARSVERKSCPDVQKAPELSARTEVLVPAADGRPRVDAVVYPVPDHEGRPWSQWGRGTVAGGHFYSAVGDHCGINGNSYFYDFDPASGRLRLMADAASAAGHENGAWGYGKVHGGLVVGRDGAVYASTYWGSRRGIRFDKGYDGDVLLRIDPKTGEATSLGTPVPKHGTPSVAGSADHDLVYGEAVDPSADEKEGTFFAYDVGKRKMEFQTDESRHAGFRSILVDAEGRAYFSAGARKLWRYTPGAGRIEEVDGQLPGEYLRAASPPAPDGTVYGVTREPDVLFSMAPDGSIKEMGPVRGYVASLAIDPTGRWLYYVPGAHGKAWEQETPVVRVDTRTGDEKVIVELAAAGLDKLRLRLGGTYNIVADPGGGRLYVGLNAGPAAEKEEAFGSVVLAVIHLTGND